MVVLDGLRHTWSSWKRLSCREGAASAGTYKSRGASLLPVRQQQSLVCREKPVSPRSEVNLAAMEGVSNPGDSTHHHFQSAPSSPEATPNSCILPPAIRGSSKATSWELSPDKAGHSQVHHTFSEGDQYGRERMQISLARLPRLSRTRPLCLVPYHTQRTGEGTFQPQPWSGITPELLLQEHLVWQVQLKSHLSHEHKTTARILNK